MRSFVYYVSGHGFGHARRSAEIIRAMLRHDQELTVHVRTSAPRAIFDTVRDVRLQYHSSAIDPGVVERDPLNLNMPATLDRIRTLLQRADDLTDDETRFIRDQRASLVLADVPFLAGEVAARAGVPCLAVSNFTWDWIFERLAETGSERELLKIIRNGYAKMAGLIRLPFGHDNPWVPRIVDVPLVANRSTRGPAEILGELNLSQDQRPRILIGMRGGVSVESLRTAASQSRRLLFITPYQLSSDLPRNVVTADCDAGCPSTFADLTSVSDVVVSKLGYGIVADCIAARTRLLWPRRKNFREDELTEAGSRRYTTHREIPTKDFYEGKWNEHLEALLAQPMPTERPTFDGPEVAAKVINEWR